MKTIHRNLHLYPFILIPIFVWIGFVCAISFMEAWLKFQAPNVSLSIGLGIGKLVFAMLNKIEWCFVGLISMFIFLNQTLKNPNKKLIFFYTPVCILTLQTAYLLPLLNERAEIISQGMDAIPSFVHFYYIFLEVIKVTTLFLFGINIVDNLQKNKLS